MGGMARPALTVVGSFATKRTSPTCSSSLPDRQRMADGRHIRGSSPAGSGTPWDKAIADVRRRSPGLARSTPPMSALEIEDNSKFTGQVAAVTTALHALVFTIAAVSLLLGGLGVANMMVIAVTERTRELGLRKALGATPQGIFFQVLCESLVILSGGGGAGILLGALACASVGYVPMWCLQGDVRPRVGPPDRRPCRGGDPRGHVPVGGGLSPEAFDGVERRRARGEGDRPSLVSPRITAHPMGERRALHSRRQLNNRGRESGDHGPFGLGKSTLMNILGCLDNPTRLLPGLAGDVSRLGERELARGTGRLRLPVLQPTPGQTRFERRAALVYAVPARAKEPRRLSRRLGLPTGGRISPPSCPAASASAWRSRGPSRPSLASSSLTSRPATWTRRTRRRSWRFLPRPTAGGTP